MLAFKFSFGQFLQYLCCVLLANFKLENRSRRGFTIFIFILILIIIFFGGSFVSCRLAVDAKFRMWKVGSMALSL